MSENPGSALKGYVVASYYGLVGIKNVVDYVVE